MILSPLLSNLYLMEFDLYLDSLCIPFVRYADDIRVFAKSIDKLMDYFNIIKSKLEELKLTLNKDKTKINSSNDKDITYLGYRFCKLAKNNSFEAIKINNKEHKYLLNWTESSLEMKNGEYHLLSDGIITINDFNILFENENKKVSIPIECTDKINIYSNITFSTNFFSVIAKKNIMLDFYDKYSELIGMFIPKKYCATKEATLLQLKAYMSDKTRLEIAKEFVVAAGHNLRENLKYYYQKRNINDIKLKIIQITSLLKKEKDCETINQLLSIEGRVRIIYYSCINSILNNNSSFAFNNRNKRPPRDPINALISYGNTILYRFVAKKIYRSHLDIKIGYLHSTNKRNESLNLDISEIFRPIIVDKVIFSLINRHEIKAELHFDYTEGKVYLNNIGRRIFIKAFNEKLNSKIKIDKFYYNYDELISHEITKFYNYISKNEKYKAFKYFL